MEKPQYNGDNQGDQIAKDHLKARRNQMRASYTATIGSIATAGGSFIAGFNLLANDNMDTTDVIRTTAAGIIFGGLSIVLKNFAGDASRDAFEYYKSQERPAGPTS